MQNQCRTIKKSLELGRMFIEGRTSFKEWIMKVSMKDIEERLELWRIQNRFHMNCIFKSFLFVNLKKMYKALDFWFRFKK